MLSSRERAHVRNLGGLFLQVCLPLNNSLPPSTHPSSLHSLPPSLSCT